MAKVANMSGRKISLPRLCDHFGIIPRPTQTPLKLFTTNAGLLVDKLESWVAPTKLGEELYRNLIQIHFVILHKNTFWAQADFTYLA